LSLPPPGFRADTSAGSCSLIHCSQCGHHDPGRSAALASHVSTLLAGGPSVQWLYLVRYGGLIAPAI
jgi:hypothetical protein